MQKKQIQVEIKEFYERYSFPEYEKWDSPTTLMVKAEKGIYAQMLDKEIPPGSRVLDAGCGTGQLSIFLALGNRYVTGIDLSQNSLDKANNFKNHFGIDNVIFENQNIFDTVLKPESFNYVFCNGVLHHTPDPYGGFKKLVELVKPDGYIIIGLYNTYGRLLHNLRKFIFKITGDRFLFLDYYMRRRDLDLPKKQIWFADQYKNPHESMHTVDEVLQWFDRNNIKFINAIPTIEIFGKMDSIFKEHSRGTKLTHFLIQLNWIFSKHREGGFFIIIGQKLNKT